MYYFYAYASKVHYANQHSPKLTKQVTMDSDQGGYSEELKQMPDSTVLEAGHQYHRYTTPDGASQVQLDLMDIRLLQSSSTNDMVSFGIPVAGSLFLGHAVFLICYVSLQASSIFNADCDVHASFGAQQFSAAFKFECTDLPLWSILVAQLNIQKVNVIYALQIWELVTNRCEAITSEAFKYYMCTFLVTCMCCVVVVIRQNHIVQSTKTYLQRLVRDMNDTSEARVDQSSMEVCALVLCSHRKSTVLQLLMWSVVMIIFVVLCDIFVLSPADTNCHWKAGTLFVFTVWKSTMILSSMFLVSLCAFVHLQSKYLDEDLVTYHMNKSTQTTLSQNNNSGNTAHA
jgi:hypothetical protein